MINHPNRSKASRHSPGVWKMWNSGYANAPTVIYVGDDAPVLDKNNKLKMNGSTFIAEVSTTNMHLTQNEDIVLHHNDFLIAAAPALLASCAALKAEIDRLKWGQQFPGRPHAVMDAAEAAIAKAAP